MATQEFLEDQQFYLNYGRGDTTVQNPTLPQSMLDYVAKQPPGYDEEFRNFLSGLFRVHETGQRVEVFIEKLRQSAHSSPFAAQVADLFTAFAHQPSNYSQKRNGLTRREFIPLLTTASAAAAATMRFGLPAFPQNRPPEAAETEVESEEHNPDYISEANLRSAAAVSALFATIVGAQAATSFDAINDAIPQKLSALRNFEMSPKTSLTMFTAWLSRVAYLAVDSARNPDPHEREGSKHAYEHELGELKNVAIAFGLVGFAEVASHIRLQEVYSVNGHKETTEQILREVFADGEEVRLTDEVTISREDLLRYLQFDPETLQKIEGLSPEEKTQFVINQLDQYIDSIRIERSLDGLEGNLDSIPEERLREEIAKYEKELRVDALKNNYLCMITAPFSLTFTTANLANNTGQTIATRYYRLHYYREALKAKREGMQFNQVIAEENANKATKIMMNSPIGFVNLALSTAANLDGTALAGDPPNIFYVAEYGVKEWLENSAIGFGFASVMSTAAYNAFLVRYFGANKDQVGANIKGANEAVKIWGRTVAHMGKKIFRKAAEAASRFHPKIAEIAENFDSSYDVHERMTINLDDLLEDVWGKAAELLYFDDLKKLFGKKSKKAGADQDIPNEGPDHDPIQDIEDLLIHPETDPQQAESLGAMKSFVEGFLTNLSQFETAEGAMEALENDPMFSTLFTEHENLRKDFINKIRKLKEEEKAHHQAGHGHKASHAALETRNALLTQLWAVGSLQTVTKKFLRLDDPQFTVDLPTAKRYVSTILGIIGITSSIADNVAAMLFGIDVLEKVGQKFLGMEAYAENEKLGKLLRRYAFFMAVIAGALSKIGNGPNMAIQKLKNIARSDDENILETLMQSNTLGESFTNVYSWIFAFIMWGIGSYHIGTELDKVNKSQHAAS